MIFIDGTNFDRMCLECFGRNDIDFEKLLSAVSAGTKLLHTYYVTAPYNRGIYDDRMLKVQTGMINRLRRMPDVTVDLQQHRMREERCRKCGWTTKTPREKGTDVSVAAFLTEHVVKGSADDFILIANDSDYAPAFKTAQRYNRRPVLASVIGGGMTDYGLKTGALANVLNLSKRFVRMDLPFLDRCWMEKPK